MKHIFFSALILLFLSSTYAQVTNTDSSAVAADTTTTDWELEADFYYYIVPGETNTLSFTGYADFGSLHFEARYNYEDRNTASIFGGYRLETGNRLVFGATPVAGVVFGNTNGLAPGLLLDLSYGMFDFYSESEYLFDFEDKENNFYYAWVELAVSPFENFRTGVSGTRTRLYQTDLEFQHAVFAQYSWRKLTGGLHCFNPFSDDYFLIATLAIEF